MTYSEGKIKTSKTARYFSYGNPKSADTLWIVLHGYGQLAEFFVRKFSVLDPQQNFVVAPEGLHRFYLKNSSGRVGASWMTKEARLDDIADYVTYLDHLNMLFQNLPASKNTIILGFSQGAATACRWISSGTVTASKLILWAGVFPPDLDMETALPVINSLPVFYCLGVSDSFFPPEKQQELLEFLNEMKVNYQLFSYKGGHTIPADALLNLHKQMRRL